MNTDTQTNQAPSVGQRESVVALLLEHGPEGATNTELNARLWELRRAGHNIRTENLGNGLFRFVLVSAQHQSGNSNNWSDHRDADPVRNEATSPANYERRTRELHDRAMPLFAGVRP